MTLPTYDAQSSRPTTPRRQQFIPSMLPTPSAPPAHSIPDTDVPSIPPSFTLPMTPMSSSPTSASIREYSDQSNHEHAVDFATHSWDLATGGLKTLTAKRELPPRLERRATGAMVDTTAETRSYAFAMAILVCIILMLIGGGVVLFVMMQP